MNNNNFNNIGSIDQRFVQRIKYQFGNMKGFHWNTADNNNNNDDGVVTGWYWTVDENINTTHTNRAIYECYIRYLIEQHNITAYNQQCTKHTPNSMWARVLSHYKPLLYVKRK
jgi:hypothetical protein